MSILSSIIGLVQGNRAANAIALGNNDAMQGILKTNDQNRADVTGAGRAAVGAVNNATGAANDTLAGGYNRSQAINQPFVDAGGAGLQGLRDLSQGPAFSWDPSKIASDPGYAFRVQQGTEQLQNNAALHGLSSSGNFAKDLASFNAGTNAQFENDDFNRALSTFKTNSDTSFRNFSALAGLGENAATRLDSSNKAFTLPMAENTRTAGLFEGATDTDLAKFLASQNAGAAKTAGDYRVHQAEGTAAKDLNTGNQVSAGLGDLASLLFGGGSFGQGSSILFGGKP